MTKELRWTVAFFEWAERIQRYTDQNAKYSYVNEIIDFVSGGMTDDSFIDGVSRIVSLGCHRDGWDRVSCGYGCAGPAGPDADDPVR